MIAANEAVATLLDDAQACRRSTASTSAPTRARVERLVDQLASLDVPTPPLPEHDDAAAGARTSSAAISQLVAAARPPHAATAARR